jgi:hypothetical protein
MNRKVEEVAKKVDLEHRGSRDKMRRRKEMMEKKQQDGLS